jgi:hypothetical protein
VTVVALYTPIGSEKMAPKPKPEKGKQPGSTGPPKLGAVRLNPLGDELIK